MGNKDADPQRSSDVGQAAGDSLMREFEQTWEDLDKRPVQEFTRIIPLVRAIEMLRQPRMLPLVHRVLQKYWKEECSSNTCDYNIIPPMVLDPALKYLKDLGDQSSLHLLLSLGLHYDSSSDTLQDTVLALTSRFSEVLDEGTLRTLSSVQITGTKLCYNEMRTEVNPMRVNKDSSEIQHVAREAAARRFPSHRAGN